MMGRGSVVRVLRKRDESGGRGGSSSLELKVQDCGSPR